MALKKWIFGTPMGKQLIDQNANIEAIDSAINKISGVGAITWANLSQDVKENITGGNTAVVGVDSVSTVNIVDKSITPEKISYFKIEPSKNLFDASKVISGQVSPTGVFSENGLYRVTDYIPVEPGQIYTSLYAQNRAFYDANKVLLRGEAYTQPKTMLMDADTRFIRYTLIPTNISKEMFFKGNVAPNKYVSYSDRNIKFNDDDKIFIENKNFNENTINGNVLSNKTITADKISYLKAERINLFDKNKISPVSVDPALKAIVPHERYVTSDYIPVEPNEKYVTRSVGNRAYFDKNKNAVKFVQYTEGNNITIDSNVYYIRFTIDVINYGNEILDNLMFVKGEKYPSKYYPYDYMNVSVDTSKVNFDLTGDSDTNNGWLNNRFLLPDKLYMIKDIDYSILSQNMNYTNVINNDKFRFEITAPTYNTVFEDKAELKSSIKGKYATKISGMYDDDYSKVLIKNVELNFTDTLSKTNKTPKILMIGDSITNRQIPFFTNRWLKEFGQTPTFIGTMDNGGINGEGREGWRWTDFTGKTAGGTAPSGSAKNSLDVNPFLNNGVFDFSHYMTSQGFSGVEYVTIMLGTNDINNYTRYNGVTNLTISQIIQNMKDSYDIIEKSIHVYDPNIKIGVAPPVNAGISNTVFFEKWRNFVEEEIAYLQSKPNTYVLGNYLAIGTISGKESNNTGTPVSAINNTRLINASSDVHDDAPNRNVSALWYASWIMNMLV